jgi:hypothetical protein
VQANAGTKLQCIEGVTLPEDADTILRLNRGRQAALDVREAKGTKIDLSNRDLRSDGVAFVGEALKVGTLRFPVSLFHRVS